MEVSNDRGMRYYSGRSQVRLTDAEQQRIARHYYALHTAVSTDPASSCVEALHRQLQDAYKTYTLRSLGDLPTASEERRQWVARVFFELLPEVSVENWSLGRRPSMA